MLKNHSKIWRNTNLINKRGLSNAFNTMQYNSMQFNGCYILVTQPYFSYHWCRTKNMSWEINLFWNHFKMHTLYFYKVLNTVRFQDINIFLSWQISWDICNERYWCPTIKGRPTQASSYNFRVFYGRNQINLEIFNRHFN